MSVGVWIAVGWLWVTVWTAIAARVAPAHVMPDAAIIVVAFLALRRTALPLAFIAMSLGYLVGRQALAPVGLHETAMLATAIGVYVASGRIAGGGALFFALVTGAATVGYHAVILALLLMSRGTAGFSSWATAALIPEALVTGALGLVVYYPMLWLETRLVPERHEELRFG